MSGEGGRKAGQPRKTAGKTSDSSAPLAGASCPIVGVGASAGGLEAFARLLRALPERVGMALILVQHLDPSQQSMLADILGRDSKLPVTEAVDGMRVEEDHVYVMPSNVTMRISGGTLQLEKRPQPPTQVLPVDTLLRSIAEDCGSGSIGVVLSGTGSDGTSGLAAIKEAGGLTFAQDPSTAEYGGMPTMAVEAGVVDSALEPEDIARELVRLGEHPALKERRVAGEPSEELDEDSFARILTLVRDTSGLDLSSYRRTTLLRRISRRMLLDGVSTMREYLQRLRQRPAEVEALYRDILVNTTEFFRDPDALEALKREVFPEILARRGSDESIRIWVPGCSKGQEAYSILMTLVEFLGAHRSVREVQMFASDVNEKDIEVARAGVYPQGTAHEVSPERLSRFFVQVPGGYQIDRSIREMCVFAVHDVTKDPPFSKLDLVSFRNVLIYMERPLQRRVLQVLHYALEAGGFLMLGSSETTGTESALFSVVDKKHRIYKRKPGAGKLLSALAPSAGGLGFARRSREVEWLPAFDVLAEAERIVQGGYQPAAILVTADLDVLQFRGHVGPFLDPTEGVPELKLPRLVAPGLSSTIEAAIREAAKTNAAAKRRGSSSEHEGVRRGVDVEAVPIVAPAGESYYLVLLKQRPRETPEPDRRTRQLGKQAADGSETDTLRRELDETREQLDAVASERESANSDLRVANERFQSSNEELRTINEEFQTAQEELQSTNEELTTLNDELRNRNMELGRLADDLNNVIEGVEIPILILDAELRIRRFTPQADAIVSIVPTDVGRPVTDLSLKVDIPDFRDRVRQALERNAQSQTEVRSVDGRWYSMRIRPYETSDDDIDGAVIAFIDIDELHETKRAAEAARDHAEAVVETVKEPLLTLAPDLSVREANRAFHEVFAVSAEETIGKSLYELGDGQWDFPELRSLLEQVLPGPQDFANLEVERDFPRIGHRVMVMYARRVREEQGQPSILLAISDVTRSRRDERLSAALTSISVAIGSTLQFDRILERVLKEAREALGAQSAVVLLKQDAMWVVKNALGFAPKLVGRVLREDRLPLALTSSETREPLLLEQAQASRLAADLGEESDDCTILVVPLLLREEKIGSVSFHYRPSTGTVGDAEMDFSRRLGTLLSLASENARLYDAQREIADTLQAALLTVPRKIAGLEFGYLYRSATESAAVGGDFYDLFELDAGRAGVLLGDVSGKGVQAATLTALVKNTIRAFAYENDSPAAVIAKTSDVIFKATPPSIFVTLLFCILDVETGRLVYCSAGHTRSIVKRVTGEAELLEVGSPLAGALGSLEFEDGETALRMGDVLVLYTDGVTEARRDQELFGEERLVEFIRQLDPMPAREVPEAVFGEVLRFTDGKLSDDVAVVAVARKHEV